MKSHQDHRERIVLMLYDELSEPERRDTEEHLKTCEACREELDQLRRFHKSVDDADHGFSREVPDRLLQEARQELRGALRSERGKQQRAFGARVIRLVRPWIPDYRVAIGLAAALAVGVLAGYIIFAAARRGLDKPRMFTEERPYYESNVEISNVRFLSRDTQSGEVEFAFDTVRPMTVRGRVDDPRVQKVLTYALLKEQNPGVRLQAVDTMRNTRHDSDIEQALIASLKFDPNDGVRKEAFSVLQQYPYNNDIKHALLYVLQNDNNPGMRVAAIKVLEARKDAADQDVLPVLRDRVRSDDNHFVRTVAQTWLKEVKEQ